MSCIHENILNPATLNNIMPGDVRGHEAGNVAVPSQKAHLRIAVSRSL